jgi:hypothetical protein
MPYQLRLQHERYDPAPAMALMAAIKGLLDAYTLCRR